MSRDVREVLEREMESVMGAIRKQMPAEARTLEALLLTMKNLEDGPEDTEYAGYKNVIDAIVSHLKKMGYKSTGAEIISAIVRGGGGRTKKKRNPALNVSESIRKNLANNVNTQHIRVIGPGAPFPVTRDDIDAAVIGLYDWSDEHP